MSEFEVGAELEYAVAVVSGFLPAFVFVGRYGYNGYSAVKKIKPMNGLRFFKFVKG